MPSFAVRRKQKTKQTHPLESGQRGGKPHILTKLGYFFLFHY